MSMYRFSLHTWQGNQLHAITQSSFLMAGVAICIIFWNSDHCVQNRKTPMSWPLQ